MLQIVKNRPMSLDGGAQTRSVGWPLHFSEKEMQKCSADHLQEQWRLQELREMMDLVGTYARDPISDKDELERCKAIYHPERQRWFDETFKH